MSYNPKVSVKLCKDCIYMQGISSDNIGYCLKKLARLWVYSVACYDYDDSDIF